MPLRLTEPALHAGCAHRTQGICFSAECPARNELPPYPSSCFPINPPVAGEYAPSQWVRFDTIRCHITTALSGRTTLPSARRASHAMAVGQEWCKSSVISSKPPVTLHFACQSCIADFRVSPDKDPHLTRSLVSLRHGLPVLFSCSCRQFWGYGS